MTREFFAAGADGTRLYVRHRAALRSPGEPALTALLVDGIACDGFIWKYLWEELARPLSGDAVHLDVAHFNYRGHGRSGMPVDPERIDVVDHARDLDAVRLSLGDPDVVLFGHSMGCQVALEAAHLRPDRVRGLVLLCGSPGRVTHSFKGSDRLAQVLPRLIAQVDAHPNFARAVWGNVPPEVALRVAKLMGDIDASLMDPDELLPYLRHMVDIDLPMFLRMLRLAGEHDAAPYLPEILVPTLVVGGDKDSFTPPRFAESMADALPRGELFMVSATHVAPLEQKEAVHRRIAEFLCERVLPALSPPAR